jgi:DNA-binding MarR family transcriptional regulator
VRASAGHPDAEANILGALALVIADQITAAAAHAAGQSVSGATALSALAHFLHRPSLDRLHSVLGLTSSGAVRLVDRLEADGFVTRSAGPDGRTRSVVLTARGRRVAERVAAARAAVLQPLVDDLSSAEQETLRDLLSRMMAKVVAAKEGGAWICRLCDIGACGRGEGRCPAANAGAVKYGQSDDS